MPNLRFSLSLQIEVGFIKRLLQHYVLRNDKIVGIKKKIASSLRSSQFVIRNSQFVIE